MTRRSRALRAQSIMLACTPCRHRLAEKENLPVMPRTSPVPTGRPSFLAAPRCADLDLLNADVAVLGVPYTTPCDLIASRSPSGEAPGALREQSLSLAGRLTHYDFDFGGDLFAGRHVRIVDCGDAGAVAGRYDENARNVTAAVRTVKGREAGVGSALPGWSTART